MITNLCNRRKEDLVAKEQESRSTILRVLYFSQVTLGIANGLSLSYVIVYLHRERHISYEAAGVLLAVEGVIGILAGGPAGALIDRFGAARILVSGFLVSALSMVLLADAHTLATGFVAILAMGLTNSMIWPGIGAFIGEVVSLERQPKVQSFSFAIFNFGFGLGAVVSSFLINLSKVSTFVLIYHLNAGFSLLGALIFIGGLLASGGGDLLLRPMTSESIGKRNKFSTQAHSGKAGYRAVFTDRVFVRYVVLSFFLILFGYAQLEAGWTAFVTRYSGSTARIIGFAFALNTAVIVLAQMAVTRWSVGKKSSTLLFLVGMCWAFSWLLSGLTTFDLIPKFAGEILVITSLGLFALGEVIYSPIRGTIPNALAPDEIRGRYNSLAGGTWGAAQMFGAPVSGLLLSAGQSFVWFIPVAIGAALSGIGFLSLRKRLPENALRLGSPNG